MLFLQFATRHQLAHHRHRHHGPRQRLRGRQVRRRHPRLVRRGRVRRGGAAKLIQVGPFFFLSNNAKIQCSILVKNKRSLSKI